jgi:hypothetical protein
MTGAETLGWGHPNRRTDLPAWRDDREKNRGTCCSHRTRSRPFRGSVHQSACDHSARHGVVSRRASKHPKPKSRLGAQQEVHPPPSPCTVCAYANVVKPCGPRMLSDKRENDKG